MSLRDFWEWIRGESGLRVHGGHLTAGGAHIAFSKSTLMKNRDAIEQTVQCIENLGQLEIRFREESIKAETIIRKSLGKYPMPGQVHFFGEDMLRTVIDTKGEVDLWERRAAETHVALAQCITSSDAQSAAELSELQQRLTFARKRFGTVLADHEKNISLMQRMLPEQELK